MFGMQVKTGDNGLYKCTLNLSELILMIDSFFSLSSVYAVFSSQILRSRSKVFEWGVHKVEMIWVILHSAH